VECVRLLIGAGAPVNAERSYASKGTPLHEALDYPEIVRDRGARQRQLLVRGDDSVTLGRRTRQRGFGEAAARFGRKSADAGWRRKDGGKIAKITDGSGGCQCSQFVRICKLWRFWLKVGANKFAGKSTSH
jgi:hypothetical protein